MAEITNELMYEVLRDIQARLTDVGNGVQDLRSEMNAMRGHFNAMRAEQHATNDDIANLYKLAIRSDERLQRIERRLNLADEPV